MINPAEIDLLRSSLATLAEGFEDLPDFVPAFDEAALASVLQEAATRMQNNYPYYHPQYAGQMLKPPHAIARIAYAMAMWVNPNNHALDGSKASSPMEKEAVAEIAAMYRWQQHIGHLTGGGTMANLEALWVAGRLHPGKRILASSQAHYTHQRISDVLGLTFSAVAIDDRGRMRVDAIADLLKQGDVGTIVVTMGNTGLGAVDPLDDILELAHAHGVRVHADAAYGGYFGLCAELDEDTRRHYDRLVDVDSVVVDPHKHGLQPYGCGCVLFRDPSVGQIYQHDSPYTYFSSTELHLGEISLECSRAGAAAVALWATQRYLPLEKGGQFSTWLDNSLLAAREFWQKLDASDAYVPLLEPELDIVVYAVRAASASDSSARAKSIFADAARQELHLALMQVPIDLVTARMPNLQADADSVTCLRSVLMKPEHRDWLAPIMNILETCAAT